MGRHDNGGCKARYFIVSVGSSIFFPQNRGSDQYLQELKDLKAHALKNLSNMQILKKPSVDQLKYEEELLNSLETICDDNLLSAELGTLVLSNRPVNASDVVHLIAVDTSESIIASRVIKNYLWKRFHTKGHVYLVHGLQVDNAVRLETQGFPNLIKHIFNESDLLSRQNPENQMEMILVVTGSYKPVSNYLTVIGLVMGIPVLYHFERGTPMFLPGVRLTPNAEPWLKNIVLFTLFESKGVLELDEIPPHIRNWQEPECSPFFRTDERCLHLTAFGNILVRSCKQIYFDGLTGTWSKDLFDKVAVDFLAGQEKAGIIMIDLDQFKAVNDHHGHTEGDYVLKAFGARANRMIRKWHHPAAVARYGGEEFIAILPDTDAEGAKVFFEELRRDVEQNPIITGSTEITVTFSAGVATWQLDKVQTAQDVLANTIKHADKALLRAKRNGKNQILVAE